MFAKILMAASLLATIAVAKSHTVTIYYLGSGKVAKTLTSKQCKSSLLATFDGRVITVACGNDMYEFSANLFGYSSFTSSKFE